MVRFLTSPVSLLLILIIKGYLLLLVGGYCLIYGLLEEILKSTKRPMVS
ncbi:hypothetical protein ACFLZP_05120 [Patescibacteria group bacterium]